MASKRLHEQHQSPKNHSKSWLSPFCLVKWVVYIWEVSLYFRILSIFGDIFLTFFPSRNFFMIVTPDHTDHTLLVTVYWQDSSQSQGFYEKISSKIPKFFPLTFFMLGLYPGWRIFLRWIPAYRTFINCWYYLRFPSSKVPIYPSRSLSSRNPSFDQVKNLPKIALFEN